MPTTPVMDLTVQGRERELVIGTYGRGAWVLDLAPIRERSAAPMTAALHLYPIREVTLDWFPWETVPGDRRGRGVARVQVASAADGNAAVVVKDSTGRVVRRWQAAVTRGVNTLTWDLQAEHAAGASGPDLLDDAPVGVYMIEAVVGANRVSGAVTVRPDPILKPRTRSR